MAQYSVVQYLPNPLAEERLNIGVVVFDESSVFVRFISSWTRLRRFGSEDIQFLKSIAADLQRRSKSLAPLGGIEASDVSVEELQSMLGRWSHSVQFTKPRGSIRSVPALLDELENRFLVSGDKHAVAFHRDRDEARAVVRRAVRSALVKLTEESKADHLMRGRASLEGEHDTHQFDMVVANGRPYFAAQALSFEVPNFAQLKKSVDAIAWNLDDVLRLHPNIPLAVVALLPKQSDPQFGKNFDLLHRARRIYEGIGASLVDEEQAVTWASLSAQNTMDPDDLPLLKVG